MLFTVVLFLICVCRIILNLLDLTWLNSIATWTLNKKLSCCWDSSRYDNSVIAVD